ncbi:protein FLOURY 1-like isoform X1 [Camellia sinensis]|uniref:protein FLOURY 1-like isoform X1 n=2 Tax=Camellia sinensis TaxID=4442 RepID=UPI0010366863|nr:protein FLOURY 1-like isoform X1 [Camellia sinensis]
MRILGHFCLLLIVCSVVDFYKRFLEYILGFLFMDCVSFFTRNSDFGGGFFVFGCFRQLFNVLGIFLLFSLGFKVLQFGYHFNFKGKSSDLRNGFCSKICIDDGKCNNPKISLLETMMGQLGETRDVANGNGDVKANIVLNDYFGEKSGDLRNGFCSKKCVNRKCNTRISLLESLESELEETPKIANGNGDFKASNEEYGDDSDEQECHEEDEEVDVMALRKLVRIERQRANAAYLELEKERLAAATAAEEAMAMILKLQNDKSLIEMEANQYRRLTEEKQLRDQEVIHSLRWIVMKHESERGLLEDQLRFFRQKLKPSVEGYEGDQSEGIHESLSFFNSDIEDSPGGDALISSLEMDLSPYENMNWEGASMNWYYALHFSSHLINISWLS